MGREKRTAQRKRHNSAIEIFDEGWNLIGLGRPILARQVTDEKAPCPSGHRQEGIEGREQIVLHDQLR